MRDKYGMEMGLCKCAIAIWLGSSLSGFGLSALDFSYVPPNNVYGIIDYIKKSAASIDCGLIRESSFAQKSPILQSHAKNQFLRITQRSAS